MTLAKKRWLVFLLSFSILNVVINGYFLTKAYSSYLNYTNPYSYAPLRPFISLEPNNITPLAKHVLIFLVDGLRYDILHQVNPGNISRLINEGTEFTNAQCFPFLSVSVPGACTIGTGANPWVSQVVSNEYQGNVTIDSIFWVAKRHGNVTASVGANCVHQLFRDHIDYVVTETMLRPAEGYPIDPLVGDWAVNFTYEHQPNLMWVHLGDTDQMGHEYGALSPSYFNAIRVADAQIGRVLHAYNVTGILDSTLVLVASDHGHVDGGGHGGTEREVLHIPLILWRPGVIRSHFKVNYTVYQDSITPTISAIMGWEIPTDASGKVLFDALILNEGRVAYYKIYLAQIRLAQANATLFKTGLQDKYGSILRDAASLLKAAKDKYNTDSLDAVLRAEESEAKSSSLSSYLPLGAPLHDRMTSEISARVFTGFLLILVTIGVAFPFLVKFRTKLKGALVLKGSHCFAVLIALFLYYIVFLLLLHLSFPSGLSLTGLRWSLSPSYLKSYYAFYLVALVLTVVSVVVSALAFVFLLTSVKRRVSMSESGILTWTAMLLILIMTINLFPISVFMVKCGGEVAWFMTDGGEGIMIGFIIMCNTLLAFFSPFVMLGILRLKKSLALFSSKLSKC